MPYALKLLATSSAGLSRAEMNQFIQLQLSLPLFRLVVNLCWKLDLKERERQQTKWNTSWSKNREGRVKRGCFAEVFQPFCCDNHSLLLFNRSLLLATQIASMSRNMKPWEKRISIMCSKKGSDDQCQSMWGPALSAYSHFISAKRFIKLQAVSESWQERFPVHGGREVVFSGALCLNQ